MKKKLLLLAALSMLAMLVFVPAAMAQSPAEEGCPPGTVVNAAGTTCTDSETGEIVVDVGTNPLSNPCPEGVAQLPDGTCNIGNSNQPTPTQPQPQPQPMEQTQPQPQPKMMPKTGGPAVGSVLLPTAALLMGSGILGLAIIQRRS